MRGCVWHVPTVVELIDPVGLSEMAERLIAVRTTLEEAEADVREGMVAVGPPADGARVQSILSAAADWTTATAADLHARASGAIALEQRQWNTIVPWRPSANTAAVRLEITLEHRRIHRDSKRALLV